MNRPGRLSLRARLLVVLIAVTAAFLLIMGGVTAFVLGRRLGSQFDNGLISAAAHSPQQIQSNPGDYVAVLITSRFPVTVEPLTGSTGTTGQLVAAIEKMAAAGNLRGNLNDSPFAVPGTSPRLRAVARIVGRGGLSAQVGIRRRLAAVLVVAHPVDTVTGQVGAIVVVELITGGALILLLALGGRWLIGRGLAPLSEMAGTAQRITTEGDLTARMPDADGSTEVGRLGTAINTMLDRIQQAFGARLRSEAKVRQFAADASHELRTPLTTIRGYAELYRQGALDHEQLPDAMRRIEQEARRMGTLVAELLELARLDRTSSLDITETDLALLVRDAVADARAVEPARPVRAEAPESLVAAVDEARIRQVLANLLGNVREHTPVATPTAVRLGQVRGGVVLEVADGGPGMADDDAARAFDRFYRGTERPNGGPAPGAAVGYGTDYGLGSARSASPHSGNGTREAGESGGSGLGLAIVAAIAQAHGGQATLESAPGRGTRVRIWLPATSPTASRAAATPRLSSASHVPAAPATEGHPTRHLGFRHSPRAGPPADPLAAPVGYQAQQEPQPLTHPAPPPGRQFSRWTGKPVSPSPQQSAHPVGYPVRGQSHPSSGLGGTVPAPQPFSHPRGDQALPSGRQPSRRVGNPGSAAPRPLSHPAGGPGLTSQRPLSPQAGRTAPSSRPPPAPSARYPAPMRAAPPALPAPAGSPPPGGPLAGGPLPPPGPPPAPRSDPGLWPAPSPVTGAEPGTVYSGQAELHHDWLDPPRPAVPSAPAPHEPDDGAATGGHPARAPSASRARLPLPGRHRHVEHGPRRPDVR